MPRRLERLPSHAAFTRRCSYNMLYQHQRATWTKCNAIPFSLPLELPEGDGTYSAVAASRKLRRIG